MNTLAIADAALDAEDRRFLEELQMSFQKEEVVSWRLEHLSARQQWQARHLDHIKRIPLAGGLGVAVAGLVGFPGLAGILWALAWVVTGAWLGGQVRAKLLHSLYEAVPAELRSDDSVGQELDGRLTQALGYAALKLWMLERLQDQLSEPAAALDVVLLQGAREEGDGIVLDEQKIEVATEANALIHEWAMLTLLDDDLSAALGQRASREADDPLDVDPMQAMQDAQVEQGHVATAQAKVKALASTLRRLAAEHDTGGASAGAPDVVGPASAAPDSVLSVLVDEEDDASAPEDAERLSAQGGTGAIAVPSA